MKKILVIICFVLLIVFLTGLDYEVGGISHLQSLNRESFIDDYGIVVEKVPKEVRLISLSPTHTENLFEIGAESTLVGVDNKSIYPIEANEIRQFELNKEKDIQKIVKLHADYILVDPLQMESNRKLISLLESQGMVVVCFFPEDMDEFDTYIHKLGIISHHLDEAIIRLEEYNKELENFMTALKVADISLDKSIIIETSENGYYSPNENHMIFKAAWLAGGRVLLDDVTIFSSIKDDQLKVGQDYILDKDLEIDTYFSITGSGYSGASIISFKQKEGFKDLKVLEDGQVYNLSSELVGKYTFRYLSGIKELHRLMYQEDSVVKVFSNKDLDQPLTRLSFAKIIYDFNRLATYVNDDSSYYDFSHYFHTYGGYNDVSYENTWYDVIETVTMKAYIKPIRTSEGQELFDGDSLMTTEDLSMFLVIYLDLNEDESQAILNRMFTPSRNSYKNQELIDLLNTIKSEEHDD